MRKRIFSIAVVCAFLAGTSLADLTNGSFETGDFTGWTIDVPDGATAEVVKSHRGMDGTDVKNWTPTPGDYFALLKANGPGKETVLSQSFYAPAGYILTLDYFWDSWDESPYNDGTKGEILDATGVVATLFAHSVDTDPDARYGTDWTTVSHTFASSGDYTLRISIWNGGDDQWASYVGVDNVTLVPVPGAALLGLLGLGYAGLRLRKRA